MLRLPFTAGTTESDQSLRSGDIGEAVCRITWTPGLSLSDERGEDEMFKCQTKKEKRRSFHLERFSRETK